MTHLGLLFSLEPSRGFARPSLSYSVPLPSAKDLLGVSGSGSLGSPARETGVVTEVQMKVGPEEEGDHEPYVVGTKSGWKINSEDNRRVLPSILWIKDG